MSMSRLALFFTAVVLGIIGSAFGKPLIHNNDAAVNVITTVFSILAGFLIAIFAILGDPGMILPGSWRIVYLQKKEIKRKMQRYQFLFYVYLATLGLILVSALIKDQYEYANSIVEYIYLAMAIIGFIISLGLPTAIMSLHTDRMEAELEARRQGKTTRV